MKKAPPPAAPAVEEAKPPGPRRTSTVILDDETHARMRKFKQVRWAEIQRDAILAKLKELEAESK